MAMKSTTKSQLATGKSLVAMYFNDISPGLSESQLRFRLIHFWEAKNIAKGGTLIGIELLLIDEQGTLMQGFISSYRAQTYRRHLKAGATYTLQNFYAATSKEIYCVADQSLTVSFSNGSVLSPLDDIPVSVSVSFPPRQLQISLLIFMTNVVDVVGHLRLVNGQSLSDRPVLDESEMISMRHILVHLQTKDGPVMKLYLWDQAAKDFYKKFTSSEDTPTVLLVTTVNPKTVAETISMAMKSTTKSQLATGKSPVAMYFNDISPGLSESQLRFRLIHFWEAKKIAKGGTLVGIELLLIDEQGTVMQGFISSYRAQTYQRHLKAGATYTL
ncbi:hypothetical protein DY000_02032267 [Brassica cretica]|uniref:Replication protein A 70 kDa DNA-binding subunit B/D first OB fold domain-containing protein n=1 Tax=Brassica cretica TaxID=69181 RepID=A0ABQ7DKC1_BRACR|nr:hypothetical protein DY000_02032267 [Brassica cretica]